MNEIPYNYDEEKNILHPTPWHYGMFSRYSWYRRFTGGLWRQHEIGGYKFWLRMKPSMPPYSIAKDLEIEAAARHETYGLGKKEGAE